MDNEHEKRLTETESLAKSNKHRIDDLETRQDNLDKLVSAVEVLAVREERMESDVKEIKAEVKTINAKPGKMWEAIVEKVILAIVAGVVGFILAQIGF